MRTYYNGGGSAAWQRKEGKSPSGGLNKKGFNKLPEAVQEKISPKLAKEFNMGGMVDKRSPFMGGGIAYAGGGKAMKRPMLKKGGKV